LGDAPGDPLAAEIQSGSVSAVLESAALLLVAAVWLAWGILKGEDFLNKFFANDKAESV
jgi:hypothetical protein